MIVRNMKSSKSPWFIMSAAVLVACFAAGCEGVLNKGPSESSGGDGPPGLVDIKGAEDLVAEASDTAETQKREIPLNGGGLSNSYGEPIPADSYGPPGGGGPAQPLGPPPIPIADSYGAPPKANDGLPIPIYGVPDDPSNHVQYPGPPPDIPPPISNNHDGPPFGTPQQHYGPPQVVYGPPKPVIFSSSNSHQSHNSHSSHNYHGPPPPASYGPPKLQYGPPKLQYGPPKPQYGPPKLHYGPPKLQYGPPKLQYGPPKFQYGPPKFGGSKPQFNGPKPNFGGNKIQFGGGLKSQYGPPKFEHGPPISEYGPPKHDYGPPPKPLFFQKVHPVYGPPLGNFGPPQPLKPSFHIPEDSYGPPGKPIGPDDNFSHQIIGSELNYVSGLGIHHGPPEPDANPRPAHPGIPAPPTPPHILYDGWTPIPGLVSKHPGGLHGHGSIGSSEGSFISSLHSFGTSGSSSDSGLSGSISGSYGPPSHLIGSGGSSISLGSSSGISGSYGPPSHLVSSGGSSLVSSSSGGISGSYGPPSHLIGSGGSSISLGSSSSSGISGSSYSLGSSGSSISLGSGSISDSYGPPSHSSGSSGSSISLGSGSFNGVSDSYGPPLLSSGSGGSSILLGSSGGNSGSYKPSSHSFSSSGSSLSLDSNLSGGVSSSFHGSPSGSYGAPLSSISINSGGSSDHSSGSFITGGYSSVSGNEGLQGIDLNSIIGSSGSGSGGIGLQGSKTIYEAHYTEGSNGQNTLLNAVPSGSYGAPSGGVGDSLSVVQSVGFDLGSKSHSSSHSSHSSHHDSASNIASSISSNYGAPSHSLRGPYPGPRVLGGFSFSSNSIGLKPPSGIYGVPPGGKYGIPPPPPPHNVFKGHPSHSQLAISYGVPSGSVGTGSINAFRGGPPRKPITFRDPVPQGLIENIGHSVAHKDALGINDQHHSISPSYLPPPVPEFANSAKSQTFDNAVSNIGSSSFSIQASIEPTNLYSLPSAKNPFSFQSGFNQNSFDSGSNHNSFDSGSNHNSFESGLSHNSFESGSSQNSFLSGSSQNSFQSGSSQNSDYSSSLDSYHAPIASISDTYGAPSLKTAITTTVDGKNVEQQSSSNSISIEKEVIGTDPVSLAAAILKNCPYHKALYEAAKSIERNNPSALATSYLKSLSSLDANVAASQISSSSSKSLNIKAPGSNSVNFHSPDLSGASHTLIASNIHSNELNQQRHTQEHSQKSSVNKIEVNQQQIEKLQTADQQTFQQYMNLAWHNSQQDKSFLENAKVIGQSFENNGVHNIPVQGDRGSYTLQIQSANGLSGQPGESGSIPHDQVLSEGLLQSILQAIEQPQQTQLIVPQEQPIIQHFQSGPVDLNRAPSGLTLPEGYELVPSAVGQGHRGDQDAEAEDSDGGSSVKNPVYIVAPQKYDKVHQQISDKFVFSSSKDEKAPEIVTPLSIIDDNEIALYFNGKDNDLNSDYNDVDPRKNAADKDDEDDVVSSDDGANEDVTEISVETSISASDDSADQKNAQQYGGGDAKFGDKIKKKMDKESNDES